MKLNIEQQKALLEEGYKFCFDVVKLIIGGVILAGIMQESINKVLLYGAGFFFIVLFLVIGVWLIILLKEGERNNGTDLFFRCRNIFDLRSMFNSCLYNPQTRKNRS